MSDPTPDGRRDLRRNRQQILIAAATLLRAGQKLTASEVGARAGVSRATVYRHFASLKDLEREALELADDPSIDFAAARSTFDIHAVLEHVAADVLADVVVAEAARRAGGAPIALYLVDIDGSQLLRAAGDTALPDAVTIDQAVGPEIPAEHLERVHDTIVAAVPGATVAPLVVRDSAVGVLVTFGAVDPAQLQPLARDSAVALAVAERFTDELHRARRHRDTTASAEVQQVLLPPRVTHMTGLRFAAHVEPGYENGGNWFDHAQNHDGAWIAAIDTLGSGERAAAVSAVAHGALRAARNAGSTPADALATMHEAIGRIGLGDVACFGWVARWHAPSARLFWAAAGDLFPWLLPARGPRRPLDGVRGAPLGTAGFAAPTTNHLRLQPGELVLLLSDGAYGGDGAPLSDRAVDQILAGGPGDPVTLVAELLAVIGRTGGDLGDDAMVLAIGRPDDPM